MKRIWTRQPSQYVGLDKSNPITRGMIACMSVTGASRLMQDAANQGLWVAGTNYGYAGPEGDSAGQTISGIWTMPIDLSFLADWTFVWLGKISVAATTDVMIAGGIQFNGTWLGANGGLWSFGNTAATGTQMAVWRLEAGHPIPYRLDCKVYGYGGAPSGADYTQSFGGFSAGPGVFGEYGPGGGYPWLGNTSLFAVWNRAISDAESLALSVNPWQIFAPPRRTIGKKASGGGTSDAVGSAAGVGAATGIGASTAASVASSAGVGTATGVGASTDNSVASAAGVGTATGVGASVFNGVGNAAGTGTATGVGTTSTGSQAAASGTGTATGVGASTAASAASAAGVGTATGVSASTAASVGNAAGTGTATGVGDSTAAGQTVGSAAGVGTATGVGASTAAGVGNASGTGTATGISDAAATGGAPTGVRLHPRHPQQRTRHPQHARRPRLSVRIDGRLYVGEYDEIERIIAQIAEQQALAAVVPESNKKARKVSRALARTTMPKIALESIDTTGVADPPVITDMPVASKVLRQQMFKIYADQLQDALVEQRRVIEENNEIAIKNALELLL